MMDAKLFETAAFEAHMSAVDHLEKGLGRKPIAAETACALAQAYGDAMAIAGVSADNPALVAGINTIAQEHYVKTLKHIQHEYAEDAT